MLEEAVQNHRGVIGTLSSRLKGLELKEQNYEDLLAIKDRQIKELKDSVGQLEQVQANLSDKLRRSE